jgi:phosphopantetheinyl transferase (holo-ACP synthase)
LFHGSAAQFAARLGATRAVLSLTHTAELAMASVLLEGGVERDAQGGV